MPGDFGGWFIYEVIAKLECICFPSEARGVVRQAGGFSCPWTMFFVFELGVFGASWACCSIGYI